jgi:hypothetical protein
LPTPAKALRNKEILEIKSRAAAPGTVVAKKEREAGGLAVMLGDEAFEWRLGLLHLRADKRWRCGDGAGFVLVLGEPADKVQDQFGVRGRGETDRRPHDGR